MFIYRTSLSFLLRMCSLFEMSSIHLIDFHSFIETLAYCCSLVVTLDAKELSNVLFDVTPKWFEFGECLDVPDAQLKITENVAGVKACLNAVLKLWLEGSLSEEPYWEDLVDALKRVGNARLARHIQERHLQIKGEHWLYTWGFFCQR